MPAEAAKDFLDLTTGNYPMLTHNVIRTVA